MTANIGWPMYCTSPSARMGSSWAIGPQLFSPGKSLAVSTATTPGAALTADRSIALTIACALSLKPRAQWSVPASSGMSST